MTQLSWNEIADRAAEFVTKWQGETYEKGESQSFWSDFLSIFGIDRRRHGAFFEYAIKKGGGQQGYIDMFWPGKLLAEQKSGGKDLGKASLQAYDYLTNIPDHDLPQVIVVSDFATFQVIDSRTNEQLDFTLASLPKHVRSFGFLLGQTSKNIAEQDPVNRKAAEAMARLHNQLRDDNYIGHDLELLLVRLVFVMFADDSGIFDQGVMQDYIEYRTAYDGSDLGSRLVQIFQILNTSMDRRQASLDEDISSLPYVNGGLFAENIQVPSFSSAMRRDLLQAMKLDWSKVSPAIFGSMFQGVMDEKQRRNLGAHYTGEANILKVIKPLFLDDLYEEFRNAKQSGPRKKFDELRKLQTKLAGLKFFDPACGCGNFLVITYRELRRLEHKIVEALNKDANQQDMLAHGGEGIGTIKTNVDQMYGIEIEEFPALIAQTALWLTDHQMNVEFSHQSGKTFKRLPLNVSATIINDNALTKDWAEIIEPKDLDYILGNPPFIGHQWRNAEQVLDMARVWGKSGAFNRLDFVTCWFKKAADYMLDNRSIQSALVATNSISQGEQVSPLWGTLFKQGVVINFAHRTFQWANDAKGIAAVHCVIVGFALFSKPEKRIFEYDGIKSEPNEVSVKNINGYLADAPSVFITSRSKRPEGLPLMTKGSQPTDGGYLIFTAEEKDKFITKEPQAKKWIKEFIGGEELMQGKKRYCLWLRDCPPSELRTMPHVLERLVHVKLARFRSSTLSVREYAKHPALFTQDRQPSEKYLAMPRVSSERRFYIPIAYLTPDTIAHEKLIIIPGADLYLLGILESAMHMAWVRGVAGRLKSDYSYSPAVYNNFPFPTTGDNQNAEIEKLAQAVLDARVEYPNASLADLYDPLTMPPSLLSAHKALDRAVDKLYSINSHASNSDRISRLFELYQAGATHAPLAS